MLKKEKFLDHIKDHKLTILKNEKHYKHLLFKKDETRIKWFEIITFGNCLVYVGDLGSYTFMFSSPVLAYFKGPKINPSYWSEKVVASSDKPLEYNIDYIKEKMIEQAVEELEDLDLTKQEATKQIKAFKKIVGESCAEYSLIDIEITTLLEDLKRNKFWGDLVDHDWFHKKFNDYYIWACYTVNHVANLFYAKEK